MNSYMYCMEKKEKIKTMRWRILFFIQNSFNYNFFLKDKFKKLLERKTSVKLMPKNIRNCYTNREI